MLAQRLRRPQGQQGQQQAACCCVDAYAAKRGEAVAR